MSFTIKPKHIFCTLGVVLFFFLPFLVEGAIRYPGVSKAETVVRAVADNDNLQIRCPNFAQAMFKISSHGGYVYGNDLNSIHLSYSNCNALFSLRGKTENLSDEDWVILHILSHELQHTYGFFNEAQAECYAMQRSRDVAIQWGLKEEEIEQHIKNYYENYYPRLVDSSYRSSKCSDGKEYDLNLNPTVFP